MNKSDPVYVKADNVVTYLRTADSNNWNDSSRFVCCRNPFKKTIVEFYIAGDLFSFLVVEFTKEERQSFLSSTKVIIPFPTPEEENADLYLWIVSSNKDVGIMYPLSDNGQWQCTASWIVEPGKEDEVIKNREILSKLFTVVLVTINLMHCKNIRIVDNVPTRQQRRHAERHQQPLPISYKTIEIANKIRRTFKNKSAEESITYSMHISRGHFKDYREGPGLGKFHVHGIWWWPMHVRGSVEKGKIIKDYKVQIE